MFLTLSLRCHEIKERLEHQQPPKVENLNDIIGKEMI